MNHRCYLFLFLLSVCFANLDAQQLYFNHLSVNNGLSQGVNNCIFRDSKGFVWISSFDGLNRFDGVSCTIFRSAVNENIGLKGTLFLNILEDKNSDLWIGSNAGLNFYDRLHDRFRNFRIEGLPGNGHFYSPFYIDDQNKVWLQAGPDIIIFNPADHSFILTTRFFASGSLLLKTFPEKPFQSLQQIFAVNNNGPVLWMGKVKAGSVSWTDMKLPVPAQRIYAFLRTATNETWLGTDHALLQYKGNSLQKTIGHIAKNELKDISALSIDQHGTLWAGTLQQGLCSIDTSTGLVNDQYMNSAYNSYSISGNQLQYIYTDDKGDLWVSVWGKGVDYCSLEKFRFNYHITKEEAVEAGTDNFIRSIIPVGNEFWCGTQSSGILVLDEQKNIKYLIRAGLPGSIEHLCTDAQNKVWVSTFEGLFVVDPASKKVSRIPENKAGDGDATNKFNFSYDLQNGNMLASSNAGIFLVGNKTGRYAFSKLKGLYTNDVFLTSFMDHSGRLYISRAFKGFAVYKLLGDSVSLIKDMPLQATIKCFTEMHDSLLWIGSTIGLICFNMNKLAIQELITGKQGLSNQYIYGVIADSNYLWLSSNGGINRYDLAGKKVKVFNAGDGLQSNEFNTYSFCKTAKGEILFGGVNGLNSFYPSGLGINSYPPQLILTALQVNDTAFNHDINPSEIKQLNLAYEENTVSFQFTVINYANAAANTISYTLEGYDRNWINVAGKTLIRYANLPPGDFLLKVRSFNADGVEAQQVYTLPIHVSAPWWKQWWFIVLLAITLTLILAGIIRNYVNRKLEKQRLALEKQQAVEKERTRISRDMHDDLGSGLTKIAILSEVVKTQLDDPEKAKLQLENIAVSSRELVDNMQDIIWVLNPANDTLESLSSYIREYGLKYFETMAIAIRFDYPAAFGNIHLSEEQRRNVYLTVKECFQNIAKHAQCKLVTVTISLQERSIILSIKDDGRGFDPEAVRPFANGLKNMSTRLGEGYSVHSVVGYGTETKIRINHRDTDDTD